jgi:diguanylate cyclase (GGDEF)-like protein
VARRFVVLHAADELAPEYQWRLVNTLFSQRRSLVQGNSAVFVMQLMCFWRTRWPGFVVLAALVLAVMIGRLLLTRAFDRRVGGAGPHPLGPEGWARRCLAGIVFTAALFSVTNVCVFVLFRDPVLQLFIAAVESGWLAAANVRSAPSPLAVYSQTALTGVTMGLCAAIGGAGIVLMLAPFSLVITSATLSIAADMRAQVHSMLLAEQRLAEANERLTQLSATDPLTSIGNRRAFDAVLQTEWGRAARDATDLGLLVIDVDHFKLFNDHYGHLAGDECLRRIAEAMESTLRRPPDFAARFGGEEFVAVLPGTNEAGALAVAGRLCMAVRGLAIPHAASSFEFVTASVGAASMAPRPGDAAQLLIDLADHALYDAKQSGRNQPRAASAGLVLNAWTARGTAIESQ